VYRFRYIYVSDGSRGFLLDLIREPDRTKLRLLWCDSGSSSILRASESSDLASVTFDETAAKSEIAGLAYEIRFELEAASERFGPAWVPALLPGVPEFHSRYGRLLRATVLGVNLADLPLGYSWYFVKNLERARWLLVSALEFEASDFRIELCAVRLANTWMGAVVFRYRGVTHRLNGLSSTWRVTIGDAGTTVGTRRRFSASVAMGELGFELTAEAPLTEFVVLENHGDTQIDTTLFGDCEVRVRTRGDAEPAVHRALRRCLLELKS